MKIRIVDFSGAFREEGLAEALEQRGVAFSHVDCSDIEGTNCYCEDEAREEIARRLATDRPADLSQVPVLPQVSAQVSAQPKAPAQPQAPVLPQPPAPAQPLVPDPSQTLPTVNWIDTGDYHHVSLHTVKAAAQAHGPLTLVLFDHHPDMQEPAFGGILSCGGWVRTLLEECLQVQKAVLVGINPELASECEGFGGRVVILDERQILAGQNGGKPCSTQLSELLSHGSAVPERIYLSIDKDVLSPEFARTDWDHGTLELDDISQSIACLSGTARIVGADICGGITSAKGGTGEDFAINLRTDLRMIELLGGLK